MLLKILYTLAIFALGFCVGGGVKAFLDSDEIIDLEKKNARLHAQLTELQKTKNNTIEIYDHRDVNKELDFSQKW